MICRIIVLSIVALGFWICIPGVCYSQIERNHWFIPTDKEYDYKTFAYVMGFQMEANVFKITPYSQDEVDVSFNIQTNPKDPTTKIENRHAGPLQRRDGGFGFVIGMGRNNVYYLLTCEHVIGKVPIDDVVFRALYKYNSNAIVEDAKEVMRDSELDIVVLELKLNRQIAWREYCLQPTDFPTSANDLGAIGRFFNLEGKVSTQGGTICRDTDISLVHVELEAGNLVGEGNSGSGWVSELGFCGIHSIGPKEYEKRFVANDGCNRCAFVDVDVIESTLSKSYPNVWGLKHLSWNDVRSLAKFTFEKANSSYGKIALQILDLDAMVPNTANSSNSSAVSKVPKDGALSEMIDKRSFLEAKKDLNDCVADLNSYQAKNEILSAELEDAENKLDFVTGELDHLDSEVNYRQFDVVEFEVGRYCLRDNGVLRSRILEIEGSGSITYNIRRIELIGTADGHLNLGVRYNGEFGAVMNSDFKSFYCGNSTLRSYIIEKSERVDNYGLAYLRAFYVLHALKDQKETQLDFNHIPVSIVVETTGERDLNSRKVAIRFYRERRSETVIPKGLQSPGSEMSENESRNPENVFYFELDED